MGHIFYGVLPHISAVLVATSTSSQAIFLFLEGLTSHLLWRSLVGPSWGNGFSGGTGVGRDWGSFGGDGGGWGRGGSTDRFGRGQGGGPRWGQQDKRWELRGEVGLVAEVRVTAGPLAAGAAEHEPWACCRIPGAELVLDAAPDRQGHGHISCRRETWVGPWWGGGGRHSQDET